MKQCTLICNQANAAWGVAEMCVTDKKDVIVVSIVLPHSNDDNSVYDDGSLMRARYQVWSRQGLGFMFWGSCWHTTVERSNLSLSLFILCMKRRATLHTVQCVETITEGT